MSEKQNDSIDSINLVMYSYKSKDAIKTLENLMKTWSRKVFIFIHWHDQNGLDRSKLLVDLINSYDMCNGSYVPVHWDSLEGAVAYKDLRLKATFGGRYHLTITPGTVLEQNWDLKLINFVSGKNIIVSGNKKININNKDLFFVNKNYTDIENFTLTNYVDRNFIFGNVIMMKNNLLGNYNFPGWLKYYGEEEVLSLQYFKDDIKIYAAPENLVKINRYSTLEDFNYYVPFSKYHNYNEAIRLFKENKNNIVGAINPEIVQSFNKFHNFAFDNLKYLPFSTNDVAYSTNDSQYDKMNGIRFIKQIRKVD
jgi:hypothetical protein